MKNTNIVSAAFIVIGIIGTVSFWMYSNIWEQFVKVLSQVGGVLWVMSPLLVLIGVWIFISNKMYQDLQEMGDDEIH